MQFFPIHKKGGSTTHMVTIGPEVPPSALEDSKELISALMIYLEGDLNLFSVSFSEDLRTILPEVQICSLGIQYHFKHQWMVWKTKSR